MFINKIMHQLKLFVLREFSNKIVYTYFSFLHKETATEYDLQSIYLKAFLLERAVRRARGGQTSVTNILNRLICFLSEEV